MNNYGIGDKILPHLRKVDNLVNDKYQPFISCEIDPSNICQLNCKWCFFKKIRKRELVNLDIDVYKKFIKALYITGCKSITFTGGGEPLMNPHIKKMIEIANMYGMNIGLVTNGIELHKIKNYLNKLVFVRISLDCTTRESYERLKGADKFKQVCDNIRMAVLSSVCDVGLSMVHIPQNSNQVEDFVTLGQNLGVNYNQIKASWQSKNIEQQTIKMENPNAFITERYTVLSKSRRSYHYLPCMIAGLCGNLAANGKLYYCCIHRGNPDFEIFNFKNFNNDHNEFRAIIKRRAKMDCDITKCGSCRYVNFAKVYEQVKDKKYTMLRHVEFL